MANTVVRNIQWLAANVKSRFYKRDKNLWVFGEWFGNRCCDNSLYFANYIAENHPEIQVIWLAKESADTSLLAPGVTRMVMDTEEAAAVLKKAGVAVMNQGFVDFSASIDLNCAGAVTVNLWHGIPWKKIGFDTMDGASALRKLYGYYIQKTQRADMHLATSDDLARIFVEKFFADPKGIILSGYPRNSIFYSDSCVSSCREKAVEKIRNNLGITGENLKIITYMPTFRDNTQTVFSFEELANDDRLKNLLERHNAVIVQRAHFVSSQRNSGADAATGSRITSLDGITSQELLAATDLLVTDYSSCFFDYLMLDRPIIHHLYDYDYYANEDRGLYYKKEDVACGDVSQTVDELLDYLEANLTEPDRNAKLRQTRRQQYMTYETADGCKAIYEAILQRL